MPSDDTEQFRASQSKHAAKIAFERQLTEATGLSRTQIRSRLGSALGSFVEAFQNRRDAERTEIKVNRQDKMVVEPPTVFKPRPFHTTGGTGETGGGAGEKGDPGADGADGFTLDGVDFGDMIYWSGSEWILLSAPTGFTNDPVLRHNGSYPYWEEPGDC